ncbi:hypothetical protein ADIAL_1569 [Alkalibacterium sp. AK22]|uniref:tryptophan-rich sensory protein n=1 Tax=Alkalibacterium sp. AK22 TaxID=1229520 RepID=UPI0004485595|nr:tryptophan-rich sensory protein [Alkalibacterium sp. AK22]EXJ22946.1 hypothetical protein ADIAL_1569 [Alkalibacterium sp. AK22]
MTLKKKFGMIYTLSFILMLTLNYLSSTDVGDIADQEQAIIQPAGYVFSIWGLIYLLLLIWLIRLFVSRSGEKMLRRLHYWPPANFVLNGLWIVAFTQEWFLISVMIIAALLLTLIVIYKKIDKDPLHWFNRAPFSVYFAWGTVATIVNVFRWLLDRDVEELMGLNEYQWTLILLVIATGIAMFVSLVHLDWIYPLVFVWTYVGIILEHENQLFLLMVICSMAIVFQVLSSTIVAFVRLKQKVSNRHTPATT